jgi:hypothetical protein
MAELSYSVTALPAVWPGKKTSSYNRKRAPFKSQWSKTLHMLQRELSHLGARKVEIACEIRGSYDIRQDGQLRADARPGPAVILSFIDNDGQRQAYPCDTFGWWQDNLYAIAIVLEDLRRAERYGVQSSLIRAGFKALPATTAPALSTSAAADVLAKRSSVTTGPILESKTSAQTAYRQAAARVHPDVGGSATDFQLVQEAKRVLEAHHGGSI